MFRKLVPLALLVALAVGCKKKSENTDGKVDGDPGAAYTIKVRDRQTGDKTDETETVTGTGEFGPPGKSEKIKEERRFEYSEQVIDQPAGAARPNKLTRTYKVASRYDQLAKAAKPTKYEGKTVTVEKKGANYEYTADGKKLDFADAADFSREFANPERTGPNELFPKTAVKVGESWTLEPAALKSIAAGIPFPIDPAKSKLTGKLTRAYTKDGKQWGVVAFDFDLVVDSAAAAGKAKKGQMTGSAKIDGTFDGVIDGSSRDMTMKMTIKMDVTGGDGATQVRIAADSTQEKTVTTAK